MFRSALTVLALAGAAAVPGAQDLIVNRAYKLFGEGAPPEHETAEQRAFLRATRGVHW